MRRFLRAVPRQLLPAIRFPATAPRQLTRNEALEQSIQWSNDSRHVFFQVDNGSVEGKYSDSQTRLYWVDADTGAVQRWAADFSGQVAHYAVAPDGGVLATGRLGTEVRCIPSPSPEPHFQQSGCRHLRTGDAAAHSARVAFVHSDLGKPAEVYLADSAG